MASNCNTLTRQNSAQEVESSTGKEMARLAAKAANGAGTEFEKKDIDKAINELQGVR